jgi:hypothetical protein
MVTPIPLLLKAHHEMNPTRLGQPFSFAERDEVNARRWNRFARSDQEYFRMRNLRCFIHLERGALVERRRDDVYPLKAIGEQSVEVHSFARRKRFCTVGFSHGDCAWFDGEPTAERTTEKRNGNGECPLFFLKDSSPTTRQKSPHRSALAPSCCRRTVRV